MVKIRVYLTIIKNLFSLFSIQFEYHMIAYSLSQ